MCITTNAWIKIKCICLDFEWAVHLNRITLNFIGIWPSAHENVHKKFLSNARAAFFFISIALTFIIPLIHSLVKIWGDLVLMIDNLQFTIPLLMVIIKGVTLWWKKTGMLQHEVTSALYKLVTLNLFLC